MIRTTPNKWAVRLGNAYVEFFRNIPLLVQLFLWFFVLPELLPKALGTAIKQMTPPWASFVPAVIGLGLFTAARVSEQVRAGIQALPRGQGMAGTALGLTLPQTYRYVLLPMAFRIIMPPLTSETMNLIKNTSVALTIGLVELTAAARSMQEFTFQVFEAFTAATVIYIVVNLIVVNLMRWLETSVSRAGFHRPAGRRGSPLRWAVFDFNVIERSLGLPVPGGDDLHADADRAGGAGRHHLRHAAGDDAAVVAQVAVSCRPPATST